MLEKRMGLAIHEYPQYSPIYWVGYIHVYIITYIYIYYIPYNSQPIAHKVGQIQRL
jgi:hypothetical protein